MPKKLMFLEGKANEAPVHTVYLDAYWIDQTEVTNAMSALFVEKTGFQTDAERDGDSWVYADGEWNEVEGANWKRPLGPET